jgi:hypothetical protein
MCVVRLFRCLYHVLSLGIKFVQAYWLRVPAHMYYMRKGARKDRSPYRCLDLVGYLAGHGISLSPSSPAIELGNCLKANAAIQLSSALCDGVSDNATKIEAVQTPISRAREATCLPLLK